MDRETWIARCRDRYLSMTDLSHLDATAEAIASHEAHANDQFANDPEGAAENDLTFWVTF